MCFDRNATYLRGLHSHMNIIKTKHRHKCLVTAMWLHTSSHTHDCEKITAVSQLQDSAWARKCICYPHRYVDIAL